MSRKIEAGLDRFHHVIFTTVALALSHDLKKPIAYISEYMSLLRNHIKQHSSRIDIAVDISYLNAKIAKYNRNSGDATRSLQVWADRFKSGASAGLTKIALFRDFEAQIEKRMAELGQDVFEFVSKAKELSKDSETSEYIRIIERNQARIADQYEGLKELLVAIEQPQLEEIDLFDLIEPLIANYRKLFDYLNIELLVLDRAPKTAHAVRGQVLAAIQNLLENGLRFTRRANERNIAITLNNAPFASLKRKYESVKALEGLDADGSWIELHVRNRGERIPPDDAENIFLLFVTTEQKNKSSGNCDGLLGGGSGIGLTVSRAYLTAHRGVIFLNTENKFWTDFVVLLPKEPSSGVSLEQLLAKSYPHVTDS
jgi:signal transduction histidine kinase